MNEACRRTQCSKRACRLMPFALPRSRTAARARTGLTLPQQPSHKRLSFTAAQRAPQSGARNRPHHRPHITQGSMCQNNGHQWATPLAPYCNHRYTECFLCAFVLCIYRVVRLCLLCAGPEVPHPFISYQRLHLTSWSVAPAASSSGGRPRGAAAGAAVISSSRHMAQP